MINYTLSLKELFEKKRFAAQSKASARQREAKETVPGYEALLHEQRMLGLSLLKGKLSKAAFEEQSTRLSLETEALLQAHGFSSAEFSPQYECSLCEDRGFKNGKVCPCLKRAAARQFARESGLLAVLEKENFSTFDPALFSPEKDPRGLCPRDVILRAKTSCELFVQGFDLAGKSLLISGPVGTGKTFLANCVAAALLQKDKFILYFTGVDLVSKIMECEFDHSGTNDLLSALEECDLLIVDDLGAERGSEYAVSSICNLVDKRLRDGRKMLFTTNLTLEEIKARYSERLVSRLIGSFDGIRLTGLEDLRKKKRQLSLSK